MVRLAGKRVLVTGAAQGIGLAIAKLFLESAATVVLTDIDHDKGQRAAERLAAGASYLALDVSNEKQWQDVCDVILAKFAGLDIVINNAGITGFGQTTGPHDPENLHMDSWHQVHRTNLDGVALGCKYAIRMMKTSKSASIINISSRSGIVGIPAAAAYAASKAAVRNHTKSVALYCAEQGYPIRCNSIHPGAILTPMWDQMLGEGDARATAIDAISSDIPLKKMGQPEDVAYAALYLASDESKYVTGIELNIDGGILAGATAAPRKD
ncbi:SDR family oxidoreductase [Aliiglaciecola sp. LCG003]|uniref:SDR family oxidoreductase n=1 Tax=Aliiglaciecola sp. LCG003 TaxID=3053655 RepID=UPI002574398E|nr:SDR family oxidoreductase [Aliiglaciecola sp. LCG003]WJG10872.1 SDR family oxidoreductase [Aliiglaciecola sp. LCG003]